MNIIEDLDIDVCLLAETMTRTVKIEGCRAFTANKSVGQNVSIIIRNRLVDNDIIKMYEPSEVINLIGIRVEMLNVSIRIFTAHLKQQSVCTKEEITAQFNEIKHLFHEATKSNEGMLLMCNANVHVGNKMQTIKHENLVLINAVEKCQGVTEDEDEDEDRR